jgi:hypothetical protein
MVERVEGERAELSRGNDKQTERVSEGLYNASKKQVSQQDWADRRTIWLPTHDETPFVAHEADLRWVVRGDLSTSPVPTKVSR